MELKEAIKKKRQGYKRIPDKPPFPIIIHDLPEVLANTEVSVVYRGLFNGYSVVVTDPEEMVAIHTMGFFGKGTLSRSYPSFGKVKSGIIYLKERQWQRRKQWISRIMSHNEEFDMERAESTQIDAGNTDSGLKEKETTNKINVLVDSMKDDRTIASIIKEGSCEVNVEGNCSLSPKKKEKSITKEESLVGLDNDGKGQQNNDTNEVNKSVENIVGKSEVLVRNDKPPSPKNVNIEEVSLNSKKHCSENKDSCEATAISQVDSISSLKSTTSKLVISEQNVGKKDESNCQQEADVKMLMPVNKIENGSAVISQKNSVMPNKTKVNESVATECMEISESSFEEQRRKGEPGQSEDAAGNGCKINVSEKSSESPSKGVPCLGPSSAITEIIIDDDSPKISIEEESAKDDEKLSNFQLIDTTGEKSVDCGDVICISETENEAEDRKSPEPSGIKKRKLENNGNSIPLTSHHLCDPGEGPSSQSNENVINITLDSDNVSMDNLIHSDADPPSEVAQFIILPDDSDEDLEEKQCPTTNNIKVRIENSDMVPVLENLHLTLEEAFFLSFGLGCLEVLDASGNFLTLEKMWELFRESKNDFVEKYVAYHYFRAKGWVVKPGLKFGGDFLLYKKGPPFYHASYIVIVHVVNDSDEKSLKKRRITWSYITSLNRLATSANKEILVCQIKWPEANEAEMNSPEVLKRFKVNETLFRRWLPTQERGSNEKDNDNS